MKRIPESVTPPAVARRFLEWYCRDDVMEEVRGDLDEAFRSSLKEKGAVRARILYCLEVLLFIRSHTLRRRRVNTHLSPIVMWKNYLHVALRSIRKQKAYSAINLLGLATGLACTFLILMYVRDELSYDRYHENSDRIYRMVSGFSDENFDGIAKVNGAWGVTAAAENPSIESLTRFLFFGPVVFEHGDERAFITGGLYADSTTFDVFSWELYEGDPATALTRPNSLVLTESTARTWFGDEDPLGETIRLGGTTDFTVTGVMEDVPANSHFTFSFLASMSGYTDSRHDDWVQWNQYYTYLTLMPDASPDDVSAAVTSMLSHYMDAEQAEAFGDVRLQPLTDIYLNSNMFREIGVMGSGSTVTIFLVLSLFILLIAGVNFVNLSTARSTLRAREIGVRKSLGAQRGIIVRQFVAESVLTVVFAAIIAAAIIVMYLPSFNQLAGKAFTVAEIFSISLMARGLLIVLGIGIVAGLYPAFVLSAYNPVRVLKGAIAPRGPVTLRRGLVVFQFAISAALIMSTGIVSDQLNYVKKKPLGFNRDSLVNIPIRDNSLSTVYPTMKAEMEAVPGVQSIALSGNRPGGGDWGIPIEIPGLTPEQMPPVRMLVGDYDFPSTYGLEIVEGRSFDIARAKDAESGVLINQEMARQLGWENPVGHQILMPAIERELEVVGVVGDFHFRSMHEPISPLMIFIAPDNWFSMISIRLDTGAVQEALDGLQRVFERFDQTNPFEFTFIDQQFDNLYIADRQIGELLRVSTMLAIFVACLGLFGLSAFNAERRTREIGVRKVVGASETRIVALLTRETALLACISIALATPIVVWISRTWLESFAYNSGIRPGTLALGALLAFALAVLTTGVHAWKAARLDPATAVRTE